MVQVVKEVWLTALLALVDVLHATRLALSRLVQPACPTTALIQVIRHALYAVTEHPAKAEFVLVPYVLAAPAASPRQLQLLVRAACPIMVTTKSYKNVLLVSMEPAPEEILLVSLVKTIVPLVTPHLRATLAALAAFPTTAIMLVI
jgi:hypothetical protein